MILFLILSQNKLKKSHSKDFFNFLGAYKEVRQVADICTTNVHQVGLFDTLVLEFSLPVKVGNRCSWLKKIIFFAGCMDATRASFIKRLSACQ